MIPVTTTETREEGRKKREPENRNSGGQQRVGITHIVGHCPLNVFRPEGAQSYLACAKSLFRQRLIKSRTRSPKRTWDADRARLEIISAISPCRKKRDPRISFRHHQTCVAGNVPSIINARSSCTLDSQPSINVQAILQPRIGLLTIAQIFPAHARPPAHRRPRSQAARTSRRGARWSPS